MSFVKAVCAGFISSLCAFPVVAEVSDSKIRIGVLSDMSGTFSAISGMGLVRAVELAVEDFDGKIGDTPIDVISANYQGRADIAVTTAREWFDTQQVDTIIEATDSSAAIAMSKVATDRKKPLFYAGSASTALVNEECSPYGIQWTYNTYALSNGLVNATMADGAKSFYFITTDYAFGHTLEKHAMDAVQANNGQVVGSSRHPLNTSDFSSLLLQAQASGAEVVTLANSGVDAQTTIRQAAEFGITPDQKLVATAMFVTDIKGLGLDVTQGIRYVTAFYWDATPETRAFSKRFYDVHGAMPTMSQAGAYSSALAYLKAVEATGSDDADQVLNHIRSNPINDMLMKNGQVRADGLNVHDMLLVEVKKPEDSTGEWDLQKVVSTIPAAEAFAPLSSSRCALVKG